MAKGSDGVAVLEVECWTVRGGVVAVCRAGPREIMYHEFLVEGTCGEDLGARLGREGNRADNVGVLKGV